MKAAGFYSYDAADDSDDPVKRWIGREVKRLLHEADQHLPFLLGLSSTAVDVPAELADCLNAAGLTPHHSNPWSIPTINNFD